MQERETTEIQLSPWEIEVSTAFQDYLLAQKRADDELEFWNDGPNPLYREIDDQMRGLLDRVLHDSKLGRFIPEIAGLDRRYFRSKRFDDGFMTVVTQGNLGSFLHHEELDPFSRCYVTSSNEVLLVNWEAANKASESRFYAFNDIGGYKPNDEFVGLETIRSGNCPEYVRILKVGANEEYGPLTFNEMDHVVSKVHWSVSKEKNTDLKEAANYFNGEKQYALRQSRRELKEQARQANGTDLKGSVAKLGDSIRRRVRLSSRYHEVSTFGESFIYDQLEIDREDGGRFNLPLEKRGNRFWYSYRQDHLLAAPYWRPAVSETDTGLYATILRRIFHGKKIPEVRNSDLKIASDAPNRYYCRLAPILVENLMGVLPKNSAERIRAVYGEIGNSPIETHS